MTYMVNGTQYIVIAVGGNINGLVPPNVEKRLRERLKTAAPARRGRHPAL